MSGVLKKKPRAKRTTIVQSADTGLIDLRTLIPGAPLPGGIFAGLVYPNRKPHALILGPEHKDELNWDDATAWAKELTVDGLSDFTLMSRPEGSIAYANLPKEFKPVWYWLAEQHASLSDNAWGQYFGNGGQGSWHKDTKFRARAARRLAI